jgi:hypothetical protein
VQVNNATAEDVNLEPAGPFSPARRKFIGEVGGLVAAWTARGAALAPLFIPEQGKLLADHNTNNPRNTAQERLREAFEIRVAAARDQRDRPLPAHPDNRDEERLPNRLGSFSKGLPHNFLGEVEPNAYNALLLALSSGDPADFDAIPLGGTVKLVNPQAAYAFQLEGADSHHLKIPPPPTFSSMEEAGEAIEVYWQALTRDIPFSDYATDPLIGAAIQDLKRFPNFARVTRGTIFRGETPGDRTGPHISQFLWKPIPFGNTTIPQTYRTASAGDDHLTDYVSWFLIQRGQAPSTANSIDPIPRYIRNGRDLAEWVHQDFSYQGGLAAALILLGFGPDALDEANPYRSSATQAGFGTFGIPYILDLVARAAIAAFKAAWYQKWLVHRRLRPEAFGGRIHNHLTGQASYPLHASVLNSLALTAVHDQYNTFLLPQAFPEGSPAHPAYPSGHATVAGACVTILKAFFNEDFIIPDPVEATPTGRALVPYSGAPLTVGGELNKLAANIALGRDAAGIHWRTDSIEGMKLGEEVAIRLLMDYRATYNERFDGFTLRKLDGTLITL